MKSGVTNLLDLGAVAAGAQVNFGGGFTQASVRGVTTLTLSNTVENNVAVYVDGFYEPSALLMKADLPNIRSVEVLKGPQGTLYGRNATGGAILINTLAPSDVWTANADVSYGSLNEIVSRAYVSGPLTDSIRFSVASHYRNADSYIRLVDPVSGGSRPAQQIEQQAVRTKLEIDLSSSLKATLAYSFIHINDGRTNTFTPRDHIAPSVPPPPLRAVGNRYVSFNYNLESPISNHQGTLKLEWDTGVGKLTPYTGYTHSRQAFAFDSDGTFLDRSFFSVGFKQNTFQQMVDLNVNLFKAFDVIVGGMYYDDKIRPRPQGSLVFGPNQSILQSSLQKQDTTAWAIYGDATWHVTDALSLNVGGRYSYDKRVVDQVSRNAAGAIILFGPWHAEASWTKFTPRATLRYEIAPRTNVYASWSKGYRSGAYNPNPPNTATDRWEPVQPETVTAYEVGFKTARRNLRFNAAAFYYDFRGIHVATTSLSAACNGIPNCTLLIGVFRNGGPARIYGGEAEVALTPLENLNIRAGLSLLHARFRSYPNAFGTGLNAATNLNLPNGVQDWSGQQLARAPDWSGNIGFDYLIPHGDGGLTLAGNLSLTDSYVINNLSLFGPLGPPGLQNKQRYRQDSYAMLNASVTWTEPSGHLFVTVFGRNPDRRQVLADAQRQHQRRFWYNRRPRHLWSPPRLQVLEVGLRSQDQFGSRNPGTPATSSALRQHLRRMPVNAMPEAAILSIEQACSRLVAAYCYLTDFLRYDEQAALFTQDGIYVNPFMKAEGRSAIRAYLDTKTTNQKMRHLCGPSFFEDVGPEKASSITYATLFLGQEGAAGTGQFTGVVEFHNIFARTVEGWRIAYHESRDMMSIP